jgi:hypothetical protein
VTPVGPNLHVAMDSNAGQDVENESITDEMITGRYRNSDQKLLTSTLRSDPHCGNGTDVHVAGEGSTSFSAME